MANDDKKDDDNTVVEFEKGAQAAKQRRTRKKKDDAEEKPEAPPLTAEEISEIIRYELSEEAFDWKINPVKAIFSPRRAQQDGNLTVEAAAEKLHYLRRGMKPELGVQALRGALSEIISDARSALWLGMIKRHCRKANPATLAAGPDNYFIREFLRCILHPEVLEDHDKFENAVCVFRQWIWNCKQRINGRPDSNHIMMVFHGFGRAGKSKLIRHFFATAFGELAGDISLSCYNADGFSNTPLWQFIAGFADECLGEDLVSDSDIKNGTTSPVVLGRNMYSPGMPNNDRNMNAAVTKNGGVWTKMAKDRRAFHFKCTTVKATDNLDNLNRAYAMVDDVMNSVWVNEPEPILARLNSIIKEQQVSSVEESFMALWLENCCTPCPHDADIPYLRVKASLKKFARSIGEKVCNVPDNKADTAAALEALGAKMPTTGNRYRLQSHNIKSDWTV